MARILQVRGIPDDVYEWWQTQAEAKDRSLTQHIRSVMTTQYEKARPKSVSPTMKG